MAGINNNLYPPIVSTAMPAFVRTTPCKVYFSLSVYNDIEDIMNVQVVVNNQSTNMSMLNSTLYPAGIKITELNYDAERESDDKYYVTISPSDLQSGIFELNQYYKIQIRFTAVGATNLTDSVKIAGWLSDNQRYFSEWSTVCLIKGIQQPFIYLKGFEDLTDTTEATFTSEVVDFVGQMYYEENENVEKEYLASYQILIYNAEDVLIYDSEIQYTLEYNPNEINYTLKTNLEDGIVYRLEFIYTTINEYSQTLIYNFSVIQNSVDSIKATIAAEMDEENGRCKITIAGTTTSAFFGNMCIRRTSSESNFEIWEDIRVETITDGQVLNYVFYDYTIESGIWYKYCAQKINSKGFRGNVITIKYPVMAYFDHMFLTNQDMQLKIKFDPSISSFKRTLSESRTETIGSQYPFIRRNAKIEYRQFPISGLITAFCDEDGIFLTKQNIYNEDSLIDYEEFNTEYQIDAYKDFIYEREFREKIMDFLYANNVKLFRSTTEGNVLVRLMDITLTPNQTLGRMLYSFSATAYEIDECTLENYEAYKIHWIGEYSQYLEYNYQKIGQLYDTYGGVDQDIIVLLQEKWQVMVSDDYINELLYLSWVRITFESPPYLIKIDSDGNPRAMYKEESADDNTIYGYIVYINGDPIIVSARGYYELMDKDTQITSIWFPEESEVIIDYIVQLNQVENTLKIASKMYNFIKVGQVWGLFDVNDSVFNQIYLKYYLDYEAYYQKLVSIDRITVEAEPGSVVYVKDSLDDDYFRHVVGFSGILDFYDEDSTISGFYFCGVHLDEALDYSRDEPEDSNFFETGITVNNLDEITNPIKNGVYNTTFEQSLIKLNTNFISKTAIDEEDKTYNVLLQNLINESNYRYIYYQEHWYVFTQDNDVLCPVKGLVDYIFELNKGEY